MRNCPKGFVAWEDDERILVVTFSSENDKTGNMCQTWILAKAESPYEATVSGLDYIVCGDCKHRRASLGSCYVNTVRMGPGNVWKSWRDGNYPPSSRFLISKLQGRKVRVGSFGDPAFVPFEVWETLLQDTYGSTGYTHGWRWCDQRLAKYCMASVDTMEEMEVAQALGWRTFRVRQDGEPRNKNEMQCPAVEEISDMQCEDCMACSGSASAGKSVSLEVHGATKKRFLPIKRNPEEMSTGAAVATALIVGTALGLLTAWASKKI